MFGRAPPLLYATFSFKSVPDPADIASLPHATLGRTLLVGSELDGDIAEYVRVLHLAGGIVNRSIVQAAAKGIVAHKNAALLKEHGGPIEIGIKWSLTNKALRIVIIPD